MDEIIPVRTPLKMYIVERLMLHDNTVHIGAFRCGYECVANDLAEALKKAGYIIEDKNV